ncbi:MAG: GTPase Era [Pseudomonadota bacterium]
MIRRCGHVAIVGRPNVGKSTLLNHLVGQKLSITSRKPQTTRHQILGIKTTESAQLLFVDTPGIHRESDRALNRAMNRAATSVLSGVDVIVMVVDRSAWTDEDERVLTHCAQASAPVLLVINKIDLQDDINELLPHLETLSQREVFEELIPIAALRDKNLPLLEEQIVDRLPQGDFLFSEDEVTDRSVRFLVAEVVREKITRQLGDELPYAVAVEIEEFKTEGVVTHISALILVERKGQKAIIIGRGGERLRRIGSEARIDIERLIQSKVMLNLWVKVRSGWADDERALRSLGYDEG